MSFKFRLNRDGIKCVENVENLFNEHSLIIIFASLFSALNLIHIIKIYHVKFCKKNLRYQIR